VNAYRPRAVELFAGGGGAHLGIKAAGCETLACVEWDEKACDTLLANGAPAVRADVRAWRGCEGERVDIVWASPPCQPYSAAGKKLGSDDPRDCWPATLEQIKRLRPLVAIVENVQGAPAEVWAEQLRAAGYPCVCVWTLNAVEHGVPQRRKRMFVIAAVTEVAPPEPQDPIVVEDVLPHLKGCWFREEQYSSVAYHSSTTANTISTRGNTYVYAVNPGRRERQSSVHDFNGRRLTPEESQRIQGFPATYQFAGTVQERQKQIGNAVPPPLAQALVMSLLWGKQ
jgi:DNA (cytosine-5)-methyltransferase 1